MFLAIVLLLQQVLNPEHVSAAELVALESRFVKVEAHLTTPQAKADAQAFRAAMALAWLYDPVETPPPPPYALGPVFQGAGTYGWMGHAALQSATWEPTGWWGVSIGGKGQLPAAFSGREYLGNDENANWGEHGPKFVFRSYDASGTLEYVVIHRAGDFTKGREGHAFYANPLASLTLRNAWAIECGAQAVQLVWRPNETSVPPAEWKHGEHTILLENVRATDCGLIKTGTAVRASWPLSIFNPGQRVVVRDCLVETVRAPAPATGALFVGVGNTGGRTPHLLVQRLKVRIRQSDRPEVFLWSVNEARLEGLDIVDTGGTADVAIANDCGRVEIVKPAGELRVGIRDAADPHRPPLQTFTIPAGTPSWVYTGTGAEGPAHERCSECEVWFPLAPAA